MSQDGSQNGEENKPEPRIILQKEQISKGLSQLSRTPGKSNPSKLSNFLLHEIAVFINCLSFERKSHFQQTIAIFEK